MNGRNKIKNTPDKILARVITGDGCWTWDGYVEGNGYCRTMINKKRQLVHRVIYELLVGEIPSDLQLDHLCRNTRCCNPKHLEPVTAKVNTLRGVGPSAINSKKTHCINGHEFTVENTYIRKDNNTRRCKRCQYIRVKSYQDRNKEALHVHA